MHSGRKLLQVTSYGENWLLLLLVITRRSLLVRFCTERSLLEERKKKNCYYANIPINPVQFWGSIMSV